MASGCPPPPPTSPGYFWTDGNDALLSTQRTVELGLSKDDKRNLAKDVDLVMKIRGSRGSGPGAAWSVDTDDLPPEGWLSVLTANGTLDLPGGESSFPLTIHLDSSHLAARTYQHTLRVRLRDEYRSIPVSLIVHAASDPAHCSIEPHAHMQELQGIASVEKGGTAEFVLRAADKDGLPLQELNKNEISLVLYDGKQAAVSAASFNIKGLPGQSSYSVRVPLTAGGNALAPGIYSVNASKKAEDDGSTLWPIGTITFMIVCASGQVQIDHTNGTRSCIACPMGAKCARGTTVGSIIVCGGHWRAANTSLDIRKCHDLGDMHYSTTENCPAVRKFTRCTGGSMASPSTATEWASTANWKQGTDLRCSEHAHGPLCALCKDGYHTDAELNCIKCEGAELPVQTIVLVVGLSLIFIVIVGMLLRQLIQRKRKEREATRSKDKDKEKVWPADTRQTWIIHGAEISRGLVLKDMHHEVFIKQVMVDTAPAASGLKAGLRVLSVGDTAVLNAAHAARLIDEGGGEQVEIMTADDRVKWKSDLVPLLVESVPSLKTKYKILISMLQVINGISKAMDLEADQQIPTPQASSLSRLLSVLELNLPQMMPIEVSCNPDCLRALDRISVSPICSLLSRSLAIESLFSHRGIAVPVLGRPSRPNVCDHSDSTTRRVLPLLVQSHMWMARAEMPLLD